LARRKPRHPLRVERWKPRGDGGYHGQLPDLFWEGQGVVAEGALDRSGTFQADSVLAKHDERYMPKEVADALKKQGRWQGEMVKTNITAPRGTIQ